MLCISVPLNKTAHLDTYILHDSHEYNTGKQKPLVLVIPGGGYAFTSDREAEPVALKFNSIGCHAAVLWYTTYDQISNVPKNALIECLKAVAWLRSHAQEYRIDPNLIILCGFSAGGNVALNAAVRWHESWLDKETGTSPDQRKINLCIDCYGALQFQKRPAGELGFGAELIEHPFSSNMRFFGCEDPNEKQIREWNPLTHFESQYVPPIFIWHNGQDLYVPVSDVLKLADRLAKTQVPFELIIFERGEHGLALADRTTARKDSHKDHHTAHWFELCAEWLTNYIDYTDKPYGDYPKGLPGRQGPSHL